MDSIVWPCHTSESLSHTSINYEEKLLNPSNILTFIRIIS